MCPGVCLTEILIAAVRFADILPASSGMQNPEDSQVGVSRWGNSSCFTSYTAHGHWSRSHGRR